MAHRKLDTILVTADRRHFEPMPRLQIEDWSIG
jgi:predicted nucleic acid-binding protein